MNPLILAVAAIGLWAATGCTLPEPLSPGEPTGGALPPPIGAPEATGVTAGDAAGASAVESAAAGTSGVVIESIEPEPSATTGPTAITIPEGSGWTHSEVPLTKQQEDIETCFRFASAHVERESRIDDDRYEGSSDRDVVNLFGETTLTRRVDYYSERRRRGGLFDTCMQSKGYVKN
jgi:hypothetical protein